MLQEKITTVDNSTLTKKRGHSKAKISFSWRLRHLKKVMNAKKRSRHQQFQVTIGAIHESHQ